MSQITAEDTSPLLLDQNGTAVQYGYRFMDSGGVTVTTAGTPVQLASTPTQAKRLDITNPTTNSTLIYVGGTQVSSTKGIPLFPGNTYTFYISDLSKVWVDAATNGNTAVYNYFY